MSGLNHTACNHAVYASQPRSPLHHARLASGWLPTLTGWDWLPIGLQRWFQSFNTFIPHLQAFLAHRTFKLRPGPPEPNHLTLPALHPAVNPRADKPSTQAYRPESRPTARPLPHSDYLRVATSPHHAPNHPSPPGGARAGANSGTSPESPSDRSTR